MYEEMGLKVAWIYPENIWDESNGKYWKKENASENVLNKVYEAVRSGSVKAVFYDFKGMGFGNRSGSDWNRYAAVS